MAGRVKTKLDKSGEMLAYGEAAVRNNAAILEYCRTSMAALSGATAGLLGLTGFYGFGFYVFAVIGLWCLILFKAGAHWEKYFISRRALLTSGFFSGLFTYVLFWTDQFGFLRKVA